MFHDRYDPDIGYEPARLRDAWSLIRSLRPTAPQRQGAEDLGVTEAELVAAHCGDTAVRLRPCWTALLGDLRQLGSVQGLTRNDHAVIEVEGVYRGVAPDGESVRIRDLAIDLSATIGRWGHGFSVREVGRLGVRSSLQFFDAAGTSVHKIFLRPHSSDTGFDAIASLYAADDQSPTVDLDPPHMPAFRRLGSCPAVDVDHLRAMWERTVEPAEAARMFADLRCERVRALRMLGEPYAYRALNSAVLRALELAAARYVSVGIRVENAGATQTFEGSVLNVKPVAGWINVLDDTVSLHVRAASIAEAWIVHTPTSDEPFVSLEAFDHSGDLIVTIMGAAGLGPFEYERWLVIAEELTT